MILISHNVYIYEIHFYLVENMKWWKSIILLTGLISSL